MLLYEHLQVLIKVSQLSKQSRWDILLWFNHIIYKIVYNKSAVLAPMKSVSADGDVLS